MLKLLKLPLRIAALPLIVLLLAFQLIGSILVGLSSIVTNLLAMVFLIGSVAGSIAGAFRSPYHSMPLLYKDRERVISSENYG